MSLKLIGFSNDDISNFMPFFIKHLHATIFFLFGYLFQSIQIPTILDIRSQHKDFSFF